MYFSKLQNVFPVEQSERGWVELGSIMAEHFFLSLSDPPNLVSSSGFNWAPMGPVTICSVDGELKRSVKQRGSIEHVAGGCHTHIGFEILKSPLKPFSILSTHWLLQFMYKIWHHQKPFFSPESHIFYTIFDYNLKLLSPSRSGTLGPSRSVGPIEC